MLLQRVQVSYSFQPISVQVAGFFGFTPRVLKHYETTGVLKPARADNNGYREYSAEDVIKIQTAKQLKHANLSNREIGEFFSGKLDVEKKRDELLKIRASIDRIIDMFDLELSDGEPQFDFAEETSLFCYCNTYPLGGDVIRRYVEARETYSQAIKSGFQCDFEHTFFIATIISFLCRIYANGRSFFAEFRSFFLFLFLVAIRIRRPRRRFRRRFFR